MNQFLGQRKEYKRHKKIILWILITALVAILVVIVSIPLKIAIARYAHPQPQAIFVITGRSERVEYAAKFWQEHRDMTIWISDLPANLKIHTDILHKNSVPNKNFHFDHKPTDTVTNFTTLADEFVANHLNHLYLITSEDHMPRAIVIATLVLGSRGVIVTPLTVPNLHNPKDEPWYDENHESIKSVIRDGVRSLIWLFTGWTGAEFNPKISNYRK